MKAMLAVLLLAASIYSTDLSIRSYGMSVGVTEVRNVKDCVISPHAAPDYRLIRHLIIAASGTPKSFHPAPFC